MLIFFSLWFQYQVEIFTKVSEVFPHHFSEEEVRDAGQISDEVGAALPQLVAAGVVEEGAVGAAGLAQMAFGKFFYYNKLC